MRVHSISVMQIPVYLAPQRLFHMRDNETQIIMGIYFGIMLIMGFYNLFLFVSLREKIYLYYVLTVFLVFFIWFRFMDTGIDIFGLKIHTFKSKVIHLSGLTTIFFLNLFTVEFLDTKKFAPF